MEEGRCCQGRGEIEWAVQRGGSGTWAVGKDQPGPRVGEGGESQDIEPF